MSRDETCKICGEDCSGKLKIPARKGQLYLFCTNCFDWCRNKTDKQIRKKIKDNKYGITV